MARNLQSPSFRHAPARGAATLPLNPTSAAELRQFCEAMSNPAARRSMLEQGCPGMSAGASDILHIANDDVVTSLSDSAVQAYGQHALGQLPLEQAKIPATDLYNYLNSNYPAGLELLSTGASAILASQGERPDLPKASPLPAPPPSEADTPGWLVANAHAAANAEAVVNAVVWANGVVLTMVAVAAAAVAVVAAWVPLFGMVPPNNSESR